VPVSMSDYSIARTPVFIRAGAVIPTRTNDSAYLPYADPLVWALALTDTSANLLPAHNSSAGGMSVGGSGVLYEDDGETTAFVLSGGATTTLSHTMQLTDSSAGWKWQAAMSAANGTFEGLPGARSVWFLLRGVHSLPSAADCDGTLLHQTAPGVAPGFWLQQDGEGAAQSAGVAAGSGGRDSLVVACGKMSTAKSHTAAARA
jgi:hypothetical protein